MTNSSDGTDLRIDLIVEFQEIQEDDRKLILWQKLIPHPDRYEWIEVNGERCLRDKLDKTVFSSQDIRDMAEKLRSMPINYQPARIRSNTEYIRDRLSAIKQRLSGIEPTPTFKDKSDDFLRSLRVKDLRFVILALDVVGSTKLAAQLPESQYQLLIQTALYEFSEVIPSYHGHVLKYTGDGVLAYFPEPSYTSKNDLAWDCALTLLKLTYNALNPSFTEAGLPKIDIRIGLESGRASVLAIGSDSTKQQKDIIGRVVSMAAKIQARADVGGLALGLATVQNLWTERRLMCEEMPTPTDWPYKTPGDMPYPIFRSRLKP